MATIKASSLPLPSDRNLQLLVGSPSKIIKDQSDGLQSTKTVHFNKDIILEKMKVFKDIISYFNRLETNPHGSFAANTAYDWVVQQFAEDIYASLGLHKLEWEFDFLTKFVKKDKTKKPSEEMILDETVESFLHKSKLGSNFRPHNGIEIDLDKDLEERSDPISPKGLGGRKIKEPIKKVGEQVKKAMKLGKPVMKNISKEMDKTYDAWRDGLRIDVNSIKKYLEQNKKRKEKKLVKPKGPKIANPKGKKKHV